MSTVDLVLKPAIAGFALAPLPARVRALAITAVGRDLIGVRDVLEPPRPGLAGWAPPDSTEIAIIASGLAMLVAGVATGSLALSFEVLAGVWGASHAIAWATKGMRESARTQFENTNGDNG